MFTSDNGHNFPSFTKNLRGEKGTVYEEGIRVPSQVNWQGNLKPHICQESIGVLDWFPTLLELARISDFQRLLDGESIVPLLKGGSLGDRPIFWHIASRYKNPPCSIIRKGEWKLIQFLIEGNVELYNLGTNPLESENLIKSHPEVAGQLLEELVQWRKTNRVPLPLASRLKW